jgi:hypothetical protein
MVEVYRVAHRVSRNVTNDMPGCRLQMKDVDHAWQALAPHVEKAQTRVCR